MDALTAGSHLVGRRARRLGTGLRPFLARCAVIGLASATAGLGLTAGAGTASPRTTTNHRFHLTATLEPRFAVPPPVGAGDAAGTFSMVLNTDWHDGVAIWPTLRFMAMSSPVRAAHVHLGAPGHGGRVLLSLCAGPRCSSPWAFFQWRPGWLDAEELLTRPSYVDVHTERNPRGEIRGAITVTPIGGSR